MGPYKWHSQFFELFFVWLPTWGYTIGVIQNNITSQAEVEHHSITGDWEVYMDRHLGIGFHGSQYIYIYRYRLYYDIEIDIDYTIIYT